MSREKKPARYPAFAAVLRDVIEPTGLRVNAWVERCKVDNATMSYWLNGRRLPSPETWPLLESALDAEGLDWRRVHTALAREWSPRLREEVAP